MPTLTTHIAVAERVCTKLKLKDKDLTVLGAAIVDWSNNFENKKHTITHFQNPKSEGIENLESLPDVDQFVKKYQNQLDDPIVKGYWIHLLTDFYFNRYIYENIYLYDVHGNVVGVHLANHKVKLCSPEDAINLKHQDFYEFDNYLRIKKEVHPLKYEGLFDRVKKMEEVLMNQKTYEKDAKSYNDSLVFFKDRGIHMTFYQPDLELFHKYNLIKLLNQCVDYIASVIEK